MNIDNNKIVRKTLISTITFYEEKPTPFTWGSNDIAYEIYYDSITGAMAISEIGAFGDRTLIRRFQDRRGRGITEDEMLENIKEIFNMTYKEFKEKILEVGQ